MPANIGSDPIRHLVVLMLENRSFDHMVGSLQPTLGLEGIDPSAPPRTNASGGQEYPQLPGAARVMPLDPKHDTPDVLAQLEDHNGGFVEDFRRAYPQSSADLRAEVMRYHGAGTLAALHALAQNFTVCDHWHASVPGPTWTNRFFAQSGTSLGRVKMPDGLFDLNWHLYSQDTIYDRLNERNIPWKVYFGDIPQSLLLVHQLEPANASRYVEMDQFHQDTAGDESSFPAFSFVEPRYYSFSATPNDDHPPHDVFGGQRLIAEVYNALRANAPLWNSTLLVVLWDEHGGFYDHQEPPPAVPPDDHLEEYTFDRLGVRVPAVLVSPWVDPTVLREGFDHTSLLRYASDKWSLGPLGNRTAQARSFASALRKTPRDTPTSLPSPPEAQALAQAGPEATPPALNSHQRALVAYSQYLETLSDEAPEAIAERAAKSIQGPREQAEVARERVRRFLERSRQKAGAPLHR